MYAVIGAGPMGLAAARNLQRLGLPFVGLELHTDVGGLWDIANPHSTMYETAHLISSRRMTEFAEFPMREDAAAYPHHAQVRRYLRDYARHFGLYEHYEFATRVQWLCRPDGVPGAPPAGRPASSAPRAGEDASQRPGASSSGWELTTEHAGRRLTRRFDGVLIATGTLHHPNRPPLPGRFGGRVMHAAEYCSPDVFRGQRVLIVGCGNSGADIAVDAVHHARSVDISLRRGYYFLPKFVMGRPIDTLGGRLPLPRSLKQRLDALLVRLLVGRPSDYGLPDPDHRMYESHPVVNSLILHHLGQGDVRPRADLAAVEGERVTFVDGQTGEYDLILLATGYRLHYPFIDRAELNWPEDAAAPQLYLNMFHPAHDDLFMMGMVEAAGLGWEGRNQQARLVALYIRQLQAGHESARRLQALKRERAGRRLDGGYDYLALDRMAYYVSKTHYLAELRRHIRALEQGLTPPQPQTHAAEAAR